MIRIDNLSKSFGMKKAVDNLTFTVERGEVLGFLGPNGAGKSTTMRMITGFLPPSGGKISVGGHDVVEDSLAAKRLIGYLPENAASYPDMSVQGFLSFAAELRGLRGDARKRAVGRVVELCFLSTVLHQQIDTLSKGYRHRTCLAQSLIHDPEVLVMDEPTDGLDPNQKHEVRNLIREMGRTKAVIFSTHILEEVDAACSRAIIIDRGRIVANGTPQELRDMSDVAGAVTISVAGATPEDMPAKLAALPGAAKVEPVNGSGQRVYPTDKPASIELARAVMELAGREGWKVEALRTEEGQLDEVFRRITLPDTVKMSNTSIANIRTIAKRELSSYFTSPVAYVFLVIFLLLTGFFTFTVGSFFERGEASLASFFAWHPWIYLVLVPAVGMRVWSEERRSGTMELLLTMPVNAWEAIVAKFLASWAFLAIALALTFPIVITVNVLGDPDNGTLVAGYAGSMLLAGAYLAITCMTSALTRNQVVSFILAVVLCLFLILAGFTPVTDLLTRWANPAVVQIVASFSVVTHFDGFQKGVIDTRDLFFFLSVIGFALFATSVIIRNHRAG